MRHLAEARQRVRFDDSSLIGMGMENGTAIAREADWDPRTTRTIRDVDDSHRGIRSRIPRQPGMESEMAGQQSPVPPPVYGRRCLRLACMAGIFPA
jgi:hypothetical protein